LLIGLERYQAQHPIPNTNTDTGSDVIHSNKKHISTTGEYKVAFSLWPSRHATYDGRPP